MDEITISVFTYLFANLGKSFISPDNFIISLKAPNSLHKMDEIEAAMDNIRRKYGTFIINRGILMKKNSEN
ncbi:hypothetical protein [Clostridium sp. BJN0013]|uniref:hypothetical protein n=1 Tax=Clostridium sp. BJN0013 TaxID=3236840 RepID=UPI0034C63362